MILKYRDFRKNHPWIVAQGRLPNGATTTVLCELSAVPSRTIRPPEQPLRVLENIGSDYASQEDFSAPPDPQRLDCRGEPGPGKRIGRGSRPALHSVRVVPRTQCVRFAWEVSKSKGHSDGQSMPGGLSEFSRERKISLPLDPVAACGSGVVP
jgi:hypothetical protein